MSWRCSVGATGPSPQPDSRLGPEPRAAGHFDHERRPEELWNDEISEPVAGPWPVIEVDTRWAVDVAAVLAAVRAAMIGSPT